MSDIHAQHTLLPLSDVRVLAIEQYGAGPWGSLQLAELGAEVIKIEDPSSGGDVGRYVPPFQTGEDSLFFETFNGGKKSVTLDLRTGPGRDVFLRLVEKSDAVFSNLRGDVPAKLGIRYESLAEVNPRIVCCALTGFGMDGPRAASGALDYVIQGLAGWMSVTGEPNGPPTRAGLSLVDFCGGYVAALALLGGIWRARRDGVGCDCDVSLHETALSLLTYLGTWTASAGYVPERLSESAHPSIVPFQNFQAADGWIVVACPKDELWRRLCTAIGREELLEVADFEGLSARSEHRDEVVAALSQTFRTRPAAHWLEVLERAGVPSGPINDVSAALADKQVAARGGLESYDHDVLGPVKRVRSPFKLLGPSRPAVRGPSRGEHTQDVLRELCGIDEREYAELAGRAAFGPVPAAGSSNQATEGSG